MASALRKLRGAAGLALSWALAWGAVGLVPGGLLALIGEGAVGPLRIVVGTASIFAAAGLVAGGLYALALGTVYRKRHLGELRARRVGLWGMAGAMAMAFVMVRSVSVNGGEMATPVAIGLVLLVGLLGWLTAAGAVRLAQAGSRDAPPVELGENGSPRMLTDRDGYGDRWAEGRRREPADRGIRPDP